VAFTLTAANSVLIFAVPDVFPVPQRMQGFGIDDAFETDAVTVAQIIKGVDARKSQGFVPYNIPFKFVLQADSESILTMDIWNATEAASNETFPVEGTVILPGLGKIFVLENGTLKTTMVMPGVKKILQQQPYEIEFDTCVVAPYSP
jgi:hypothetical protein